MLSVLIVCKCQVNGAVKCTLLVIRIYRTFKPRDNFFFNSSKAIKNIPTIYIFSVPECNNWKIDASNVLKWQKKNSWHVPIQFQSEQFKTTVASKIFEDFNSFYLQVIYIYCFLHIFDHLFIYRKKPHTVLLSISILKLGK